jgi:hypothetical protein
MHEVRAINRITQQPGIREIERRIVARLILRQAMVLGELREVGRIYNRAARND